jgi:hypothetical protein
MAASMAERVRQVASSWRHTDSRIEQTSGLREPGIRALMMTEISVPLLPASAWPAATWPPC